MCVIPNVDKVPEEGVEVLIGRESLLMNGDFHSLPRSGMTVLHSARLLSGSPACLEFHLWTDAGDSGGSHAWALRMPVPPGSTGEAEMVCRHYRERIPDPRRQNNRLRRNVALVVAVLSAVMFAVAMLFANDVTGDAQTVLLVAAICGALFAPAALICAVVWHFRHRNEKRG